MKNWQWACLAGIALLLCPSGDAVGADIYVVRGKRGSITFTSRQPGSGVRYDVLKPGPRSRSIWWSRGGGGRWKTRPIRSEYDPLITKTASAYNLDPWLVKAVVHVESMFKPRARSHKGAMGLMQLMPATARRFGVRNAYVPGENVDGGARYLRLLVERYRGNERLALAAYNAGEGAVDQYAGMPPYSETQQYVKRVLRMREVYRCYHAGTPGCSDPIFLE